MPNGAGNNAKAANHTRPAMPEALDQPAEFHFYAQLNDFLPPDRRGRSLCYRFKGNPGIKDPIEALGVPHTDVESILVAGQAVDFSYRLQAGDRVAVFPKMAGSATPAKALRGPLPSPARFVVDANLGRLAKYLRLLGFDCLYRNDYRDAEVADIAAAAGRIALTRDRRLLFAKRIEHGYWVRAVEGVAQTGEVLQRFTLNGEIAPFSRCPQCNGILISVPKGDILHRLEPKTRLYYHAFKHCIGCGRIYWRGSHIDNLLQRLSGLLKAN